MNQPPKGPRPTSNAQLAGHLNQAGARQNMATSFEEHLRSWYSQNARRLRSLCGSDDDARRLMGASMNSIARVPSLVECTFDSFVRCLLTSAEFRLYPGASGECAYVPFNNSRTQKKEATFIMQYQGACQLLYRSGMVKDIEAEVVCAQDYFRYQRGSNHSLVFEPADGGLDERGEWLGVYALIRNIYGGEHIRFMSAREIMGIKQRSRASGSRESPWNSEHATDRAWMWMKTALKQAAKLAPRSATTSLLVGEALAADEDETSPNEHMDLSSLGQGLSIEGVQEGQPALDAPPQSIEIPTRPVAEKVAVSVGSQTIVSPKQTQGA